MVEKPNKIQPAIIGGVILGLLSSIPIIGLGNCCCCLWVILGGAIAARLLINRSPYLPVTTGDGALVGLLAGVVGALIALVVGVPLALAFGGVNEGLLAGWLESLAERMGDPQAREQIRQQVEQLRQAQSLPVGQRIGTALFGWFISAIVYCIFATLGGIIGVALFEKRKGQQPPPPGGYPPPTNQPPYGY